jgi:hypothetical protein
MAFHRTIFVAIATLFTVGMTSGAFAGCGMWDGCGGWGGWSGSVGWGTGCGGCGVVAYAPVTYAVPVTTYAVPLAPAPIEVGGCNCGGSIGYAAPSIAPSPVYVVNQGPEYTGPGVMEPYRTYNPAPEYAPAASYPYISPAGYGPGYGYGWHGYDYRRPGFYARPFYGPRLSYHPRFYGPVRHYYR